MKEQDIERLYNKVFEDIDSLRITPAIEKLDEMLRDSGNVQLKGRLSHIRDTYRYMLHYLLEGVRDDNRERMLSEMIEQMRFIADSALREALIPADPRYYFAMLRFNQLRKEHISAILDSYGRVSSEMDLSEAVGNDTFDLRKSREDLLRRLFNTLFTSYGDSAEYGDLIRYLNSGYADSNIIAQSISALTLGNLCFYDSAKLKAMMDIYEHSDDSKVRARVLVGIVLSMIDNSERISKDRTVTDRLILWKDSDDVAKELRQVIRAVIGTRDTDRVAAKMKDEVLPELMKLRPDIMKSIKENNGELDSALFEDNPEWQEILDKSNLTEKMQELQEMQSNGADLMMVTFSNLKQFPFFNEVSNWFLPFDINNTTVNLDDETKKMVSVFSLASSSVCDSDLYSLALVSAKLPDSQKNMLSTQMNSQFEQMKEELKDSELKSSAPAFDLEVVKSVRDLYRFFKLFRKKDDFKDPFSNPLQFLNMPVIGEIVADEEMIRVVGEFYFKRGFYSDALTMFEWLSERNPEDSSVWEKIGFCLQSAGRFEDALRSYEKASLLTTPGLWLTKKLAYINRCLGNYERAAEYYARVNDMDPDNVNTLMNLGRALLETDDIPAALTNFYHANYLQAEQPKVMRAIAWAELLNGNFAKSSDYYRRVISKDASATDYLNAGHAAFMLGQYKEARNYYAISAVELKSEFLNRFRSDIPTLESLGGNATTLRLILDSVQ